MSSSVGLVRKLAVLGVVLLGTAIADAKIIYVNGANATPGNGTSWATSFKYLRLALEASAPGDQIYLAKGTYFPDDSNKPEEDFGNRELSFELDRVEIYGGFSGKGTETSLSQRDPGKYPTILSGKIWDDVGADVYWSFHIIVLKGSSTLDGITVQNSNANGSASWNYPRIGSYDQGGGCYAFAGTTLTLKNCNFYDNRAVESGGAIMFENGNGKVVATNCTFDANKVTSFHLSTSRCSGGAIVGDVTATNCKFTRNSIIANPIDFQTESSAKGGAIMGNVTAVNCQFIKNTVSSTGIRKEPHESVGGAISGDVTMVNCKFVENKSTGLGQEPSGGAVFGKVIATNCDFSKNESRGSRASGGAIRGAIKAGNCTFSANSANWDMGSIWFGVVGDGAGGGAVFAEAGSNSLVNCVFVDNTSRIRGGGALVAGEGSSSSSLIITNSTFLNNGVATGGKGAALLCAGTVRILNNIFWNTGTPPNNIDQNNLIHVVKGGVLRNSDVNYPVPIQQAQNVMKNGAAAVTIGTEGDSFLGDALTLLLKGDPRFVAVENPAGLDGIWRTDDDGLRLKAGSSALGTARDPNNTYRNFVPKDALDLDKDGNVNELLPVDIANFVRKQGGYVDMGAYEFGNIPHVPEISVEQSPGIVLVDGGPARDFSLLRGIPTTFTIKNTGPGDLMNLKVTGDGKDIGFFKFTQPAVTQLAANESTTFTVTFTSATPVMRTAAIHIASNDSDESPFDIRLQGSALLPDIDVEYPVGTGLVDGSSVIKYGRVEVGSSATRTFTIRNSGIGNLDIRGISLSGADASKFKISAPVKSILAPNTATTFSVTFRPPSKGVYNASIVIDSNDPDSESAFLIKLAGSGIDTPEIFVSQPFSAEIANGSKNNFGTVKKPLLHSKTFIIKNTGLATLKNISVSLKGAPAFTKTKLPVTKLKPGKQAKFTVTFKPGSRGKKTAVLRIKSNDADEGNLAIKLVGTCVLKKKTKASDSLTGTEDRSKGSGGVVTVVKDADGLKYQVITVRKTANWDSKKHTVEVSPNLLDWFSGRKHTTTLVNNENVLKVRDNTPIRDGKKRYIRVR